MEILEKKLMIQIGTANDLSPSKLGLRFDRVVVRLVEELRSFGDNVVPEGTTVLITISAPIRLPAKTEAELEKRLEILLAKGRMKADEKASIHGNNVRIRQIKLPTQNAPRLLAFVHNRSTDYKVLMDLVHEHLLSHRNEIIT